MLTPEQAGRVTYALRQVVNGGTGADASFGRPAAGKTGTTQSNVDGWFVGYTPKLTTAVWMGYPDESKPMDNVHGIKVQGGTFPARIWRAFMQTATANTPAEEFPELEKDVLIAGETLDPNYGRTSVIIGGGSSGGGTGGSAPPRPPARQTTGATTTVPRSTTPARPRRPPTTAPPTTTPPPTTAPPPPPPPTTTPPTTRPAAAGTGP